jgi:DNA repair exonuclease SbcCD ATPase subunit
MMEKIKKIEREHHAYQLYTKSVCRDGIPFEVISVTVPEVEREVNSILSQISSFTAKFETDGKNIVPYIVYDDKKWLMSLTSGFEKFALTIAIRVALINISNLPKMNGIIIDEGFGVLDSENLSSMHQLFVYLKSSFDFVIIISHLDALRDMVDKHMEIVKDDGFSKLVYV